MIDITTIGIGMDTSGLVKGQRALKDTEQSANRTAGAADRLGGQFKSLSSAVSTARNVIAGYLTLRTVQEFVQAADAVALMNARLKLAAGSTENFAQAQKDVYQIAQRNSIGLREAATLYTRLADPVRTLGGTSKETAGIVDAFTKTLRISGASTMEAAAATLQFAQAMGSGKLAGDEFRSMAETSPRFMKAVAEGMGVPIGTLKEMGAEGKLTAEVVGNALLKSLGKLSTEAAKLPDTVGNAMARFKNDTLLAVAEINKGAGINLGISEVLETARNLIPAVRDELTGAFQSVGALIDSNQKALGASWDSVVGIAGDMWEVAKAAGSVVGYLVDMGLQSNLVKTTLESMRLLIAGFIDGVDLLGGAFATVGSMIFKVVLTPLRLYLEGIAKVQSFLGNDKSAAAYERAASGVREFSYAGAKYGDEVAARFMAGDTAVNRLNASLANTTTATQRAANAAASAAGNFNKLTGGAGGKGPAGDARQAAAEMQKQQAILAELSGLTATYREDVQRLVNMYNAGALSIEQYVTAQQNLLAKQPIVQKAAERELRILQDQIEARDTMAKEFADADRERNIAGTQAQLAIGEYISQLEAQNKLTEYELTLVGKSTAARKLALEQYKTELDLKEKLWEIDHRTDISPEVRETLRAKANQAALLSQSGAAARYTLDLADDAKQTSEDFSKTLHDDVKSALSNAFRDSKNPVLAFAEGLGNVVYTRLTNSLGNAMADLLVGTGKPGGSAGLLGGLFGGSFLAGLFSFDGGGSTGNGPRSGGLDGKGGKLAMLHPRETVIDHTKGQSGGITLAPVYNISIDSRSDRAQVQADMARLLDKNNKGLVAMLERREVYS